MTLVDRHKLRSNYDELVGTLSADDASGFVRPSVTARLLGETNHAAQRMYEELGFERIGHYGLIFGQMA